MNEPKDTLPEEVIDELLAPLRGIDCPDEVRRANHRAIELAFARRLRTPWWRRTVSVPLPLAIAASVMVMATILALLWPAENGSKVVDAHGPQRSATAVNQERPVWSVSRSYILSIESLSRMENSFRPDSKDKRNDS
jgi:hypothetical protein